MSEIKIPKGWQLSKISEVGKIITGSTPNTKNSKFYGDDFPFYKPADLDVGDMISISRYGLSKEGIKHSRFLQKKSILVTCIGTIGKTSMINKSGACNQQINAITVNEEKFLPKFIFYWIKSNSFQNLMKKYARNTTLPIINKSNFENLPVIYPNMETQKKIVQKLVHILDQLEKKKKEIISRIEKFDVKKINQNYKNHLLKLAFDGTLTGEEFEIIDGVKIPKGWKDMTIDEIGQVVTGSTPSTSNKEFFGTDYPFYKPADLDAGDTISTSKDGLSELGLKQSRYLPKNSILVVCIGASIGKTSIIVKEGASNQQINSIIPNIHNVIPRFLYYYVISHHFQSQIISNSRTTSLPIINKSKFEKLRLGLPPLETQKKIVKIIDQKFADWENHKQELENIQKTHESIKKHLSDLSSSILNDAFSGKLVN